MIVRPPHIRCSRAFRKCNRSQNSGNADDSPEIDAHGKEALNFRISMLIYNLVAAVFCLILVGFVFLAILWVLNRLRHQRRHPGQRRKLLPLRDDDPFIQ
ncbi:MAG: DUF4870 domain-containing protein [Chthoniobacterales bacterium]|nr:DUF4870 domain-containing protein [Chthoniobacterales bacterium]